MNSVGGYRPVAGTLPHNIGIRVVTTPPPESPEPVVSSVPSSLHDAAVSERENRNNRKIINHSVRSDRVTRQSRKRNDPLEPVMISVPVTSVPKKKSTQSNVQKEVSVSVASSVGQGGFTGRQTEFQDKDIPNYASAGNVLDNDNVNDNDDDDDGYYDDEPMQKLWSKFLELKSFLNKRMDILEQDPYYVFAQQCATESRKPLNKFVDVPAIHLNDIADFIVLANQYVAQNRKIGNTQRQPMDEPSMPVKQEPIVQLDENRIRNLLRETIRELANEAINVKQEAFAEKVAKKVSDAVSFDEYRGTVTESGDDTDTDAGGAQFQGVDWSNPNHVHHTNQYLIRMYRAMDQLIDNPIQSGTVRYSGWFRSLLEKTYTLVTLRLRTLYRDPPMDSFFVGNPIQQRTLFAALLGLQARLMDAQSSAVPTLEKVVTEELPKQERELMLGMQRFYWDKARSSMMEIDFEQRIQDRQWRMGESNPLHYDSLSNSLYRKRGQKFHPYTRERLTAGTASGLFIPMRYS